MDKYSPIEPEPPMAAVLEVDPNEQKLRALLAKYVPTNQKNWVERQGYLEHWIREDLDMEWAKDVCTRYMQETFKDDVWRVRVTEEPSGCCGSEEYIRIEFA